MRVVQAAAPWAAPVRATNSKLLQFNPIQSKFLSLPPRIPNADAVTGSCRDTPRYMLPADPSTFVLENINTCASDTSFAPSPSPSFVAELPPSHQLRRVNVFAYGFRRLTFHRSLYVARNCDTVVCGRRSSSVYIKGGQATCHVYHPSNPLYA